MKLLKGVLCHSTDWLNIFISDLDMKSDECDDGTS